MSHRLCPSWWQRLLTLLGLKRIESMPLNADVLVAEVLRLWEAEELSVNTGRIAANWGCVALLCNPERRISSEFIEAWARRVKDQQDYGNVRQTADEGRLISEDGFLQIGWP